MSRGHTVGDVAKLARVSVRALHHYDEIGLLTPSGRTESGYRRYTDRDIEKLQQVLFFRELGFALEDVARILRDPDFDRRQALIAQRAMLVEKGERLKAMVALVDRTLDALGKGTVMSGEQLFECDFDPSVHEEEAKACWGKTDAYAESKRRTKGYTREDWKRIGDETSALTGELADLFTAGVPPEDPRACDLVEKHRLQIDRWFYACSHAIHVSLGEMYVADPRFAEHYDKRKPGLAQYVCDAIRANAARAARSRGEGGAR
jgi:MerR family transcriptional regulator, thiopeptide resistance regulator